MNIYVLTLAAIAGLAAGLLIYWYGRSVLAAVSIPLISVGLVASLLPWNLEPVEPTKSGESETQMPTLADLKQMRPVEVPSEGYVASDACRECHAENHETWYASYHRTMTQVATPQTAIGDFNDRHLTFGQYQYHLQNDGNICWVDLPDPIVSRNDPSKRVSAAIVMTTGSHHMQAYWFGLGNGRTTGILPWVFLKETQEWIPRAAAFVQGQVGMSYEIGIWNKICSRCHSTHHRERSQRPGIWDTQVSEFGISCEACHGPGQQHIDFQLALNENSHASESLADMDDPIVNPAKLGKEKSAQVCGQCHSVVHLKGDPAQLNQHGHAFRPGRELNETHNVIHRDSPDRHLILNEIDDSEHQLDQWFYRDGMVRVSGREYNGLIASACYEQGAMTCLTCHEMHKSESDSRPLIEWANDQLRPDAVGDVTCLKCHSADKYSTQQHTHHEVGSSGSSCYNCHMPHTSYGLLKAIRSHTISSPNLGNDLAARRPNACNLCHLDKTYRWTADKLHDWYGIQPPDLNKDQREVAASLLSILKGNAAERAIVAWSMGWPVAQQTSGTGWQTPYLAQLLDDPYLAIRLIGRSSLRTLDGLSDLQVDLFGSADDRRAAILSVIQHWFENRSDSSIERSELLFGKDGIQRERVQRLLHQRDQTRIYLNE